MHFYKVIEVIGKDLTGNMYILSITKKYKLNKYKIYIIKISCVFCIKSNNNCMGSGGPIFRKFNIYLYLQKINWFHKFPRNPYTIYIYIICILYMY